MSPAVKRIYRRGPLRPQLYTPRIHSCIRPITTENMSSTQKLLSQSAAVGPEELRVVLTSLPRGDEGRAQLEDWLKSFFVVDQPQTQERYLRRGDNEQLLCGRVL